MTTYRARGNEIVDETGKQIAVVLPSNCTMKMARELAAYAAQQANQARKAAKRAAQKQAPLVERGEDQST